MKNADLLKIIDSLLMMVDVEKNGPGGMNLAVIRDAYDALAEGSKNGLPITVFLARHMQRNGWDIGWNDDLLRRK